MNTQLRHDVEGAGFVVLGILLLLAAPRIARRADDRRCAFANLTHLEGL